MCRFARAEYPAVAQQVVVGLDGTSNVGVHDHTREAVPTAVGVIGGGGEEHYLVFFPDDDERYGGCKAQRLACVYCQVRT